MRCVRERVEISTSFIHLAFYSKLQPDVTAVWASARVWSCECVHKCGEVPHEGRDTEKVAVLCSTSFLLGFLRRRTFRFFLRCSKMSPTSLHSLPVRTCGAAAAPLLRAPWGLLSNSPQEKRPRLVTHARSPCPRCVRSFAKMFFPIKFDLRTYFKKWNVSICDLLHIEVCLHCFLIKWLRNKEIQTWLRKCPVSLSIGEPAFVSPTTSNI